MSKSASGEIVDIDPSVFEALAGGSVPPMPVRELPEMTQGADAVYGQDRDLVIGNFNSGSQFNTGELMNAEDYDEPAAVGSTFVDPTVASSFEEFYGSGDTIVQPDQAYFESFPLPGTSLAATADSGSTVPIFDFRPQDSGADTSALMQGLTGVGNLLGIGIGSKLIDSILSGNDGGAPMSDFAGGNTTGAATAPGQTPGEPGMGGAVGGSADNTANAGQFYTKDEIDALMGQPIDTSGFLTADDLSAALQGFDPMAGFDPTGFVTQDDFSTALQGFDPMAGFDTSGFVTTSDLNSALSGFNPGIDTSQFVTSADLNNALTGFNPGIDTSSFVTQADLDAMAFDPSGLQSQIDALSAVPAATAFDPTGLQEEIDALRQQIAGLSTGGGMAAGTNQIPIFDTFNSRGR